ncbi:MAG TPA: ATPase [Chloroflexi bacterium]|nr:ATPase [Chloroflexota bacterium]
MQRNRLGVVTGGTFNAGLTVRLDPGINVEALRIGTFCVVEGEAYRYFSLIQDLQLHATDPGLMASPPRDLSPFLRRTLAGTSTYAVAEVKPMLMMPKYGDTEIVDPAMAEGPKAVRTIPMHFAELAEATSFDFADVFGEDDGGSYFALGSPLAMDGLDVCVDLRRIVERSNGVFGSTGTGKSFLTRLLLSGIIARNAAVNLIFDMHGEYAFSVQSEAGTWVKGLKELFGSKVRVYGLDTKTKGPDSHLVIGLNQIEPADILLLSDELNLSPTTETNLIILSRALGDEWLRTFLAMEPVALQTFCEERGAHLGSLEALQRKLVKLRQPYVLESVSFNVIDEMLQYLERGKHVIFQFGRFSRPLDYMLVANIVTRRIREKYRERVEGWQASHNEADRPKPLVITIEEAHKFLNPEMARQTIFGTIARELRKYFVTLLIVDQRPSGIDPEVLSQIGTRISGKLTDERDLEAVLTGVGNRNAIRAGLASLDTRNEIMIFGHAVRMPMQLRTRRYDEAFYQAVSDRSVPPATATTAGGHSLDDLVSDLWG